MRALRLDQPRVWRRVELPEPAAPGPGEALVRVRRVGVCGTDVSCFLGKMPFFAYPRVPGHELGVDVLAVGPGVGHVQPGDRCAVEPYLNCQVCHACRRGRPNCCEQLRVLGVMCDGGLTERLTLPAHKLHPAPGLASEQCALVETLAIGCHAVDRAGVRADDLVLIIGAGPIGLSVLEFVHLAGARAAIMDLSERRLAFARERPGVAAALPVRGNESDLRVVADWAGGRLADVVFDATGSPPSMARSLEFAAHTGRVVFVGITQEPVAFPHAPVMHRRELTLLASRNALPTDFPRIIGHIGEGRIDTRPWITHHAPLDEVPDAFPGWLAPEAGVVKAIVHVD